MMSHVEPKHSECGDITPAVAKEYHGTWLKADEGSQEQGLPWKRDKFGVQILPFVAIGFIRSRDLKVVFPTFAFPSTGGGTRIPRETGFLVTDPFSASFYRFHLDVSIRDGRNQN